MKGRGKVSPTSKGDPMADGSPQNHTYPAAWNGSHHPPVSSSYPSTSYQPTDLAVPLAHALHPAYGQHHSGHGSVVDQGNYYSPPYSHPMSPPTAYYPPQISQRSGHAHSLVQSPYGEISPQSPHQAQLLPRSHAQAPSNPAPIVIPPYHYQTPQSISISPQFPSSPSRPFSCDLCTLSFNRQHDLKRHRETHTGEKPYLCNGGCGKTFTRKDALKRHQVLMMSW